MHAGAPAAWAQCGRTILAHLAGLGRCDAQSARPREMNTHR